MTSRRISAIDLRDTQNDSYLVIALRVDHTGFFLCSVSHSQPTRAPCLPGQPGARSFVFQSYSSRLGQRESNWIESDYAARWTHVIRAGIATLIGHHSSSRAIPSSTKQPYCCRWINAILSTAGSRCASRGLHEDHSQGCQRIWRRGCQQEEEEGADCAACTRGGECIGDIGVVRAEHSDVS